MKNPRYSNRITRNDRSSKSVETSKITRNQNKHLGTSIDDRDRQSEGTGLGLAISKKIVNLLKVPLEKVAVFGLI